MTRHFRIAKEKIIADIMKHGPKWWDPGYTGTKMDAIKDIMARPGNEYMALGDCDNFVDDNCAGHRENKHRTPAPEPGDRKER